MAAAFKLAKVNVEYILITVKICVGLILIILASSPLIRECFEANN